MISNRKSIADPAHATSPANWPTGVSLLAQMVDACQRCDTADVCNIWQTRARDDDYTATECRFGLADS
ncbi:MAG: hypothetical protein K9G60_06495 [Pseudolabrys sp.]|nr:hypothetical protein [Pseudolabrys sp.]